MVVVSRAETKDFATSKGVEIKVKYILRDDDDEATSAAILLPNPKLLVPRGHRMYHDENKASLPINGWPLDMFRSADMDVVKRCICAKCGGVARVALMLCSGCACDALYCQRCAPYDGQPCVQCHRRASDDDDNNCRGVLYKPFIDDKIQSAMQCPAGCPVYGKELDLGHGVIGHWWECPRNPRNRKDLVRCGSCHSTVRSEFLTLAQHQANECPNRMVDCLVCPRGSSAATTGFRARDRRDHEQTPDHLRAYILFLEADNVILRERLDFLEERERLAGLALGEQSRQLSEAVKWKTDGHDSGEEDGVLVDDAPTDVVGKGIAGDIAISPGIVRLSLNVG